MAIGTDTMSVFLFAALYVQYNPHNLCHIIQIHEQYIPQKGTNNIWHYGQALWEVQTQTGAAVMEARMCLSGKHSLVFLMIGSGLVMVIVPSTCGGDLLEQAAMQQATVVGTGVMGMYY